MGLITRTATAVLIGTVLTGCATRGALRDAMAEQQAALDTERAERIAADERLARDLAALRSDIEALRTEFGAQIEAVAEGLQFAMPVHFAFDDDQVRAEDYESLERFARVVNRHYAGSLVTVEGFADPAGSVAYNRALSQRRAEAVRDRLMAEGIRAQLRPIGYGKDRLVVPDAAKDDPGAELNRRVVFVIETPGQSQAAVTAGNLEG
jgi:outer membrane protein OmpA-like peptidoglycan-associated protein